MRSLNANRICGHFFFLDHIGKDVLKALVSIIFKYSLFSRMIAIALQFIYGNICAGTDSGVAGALGNLVAVDSAVTFPKRTNENTKDYNFSVLGNSWK